jgi:hypothetical protein
MFEEKMSETIEAGAPSIKYNKGDVRMGGAEGNQQSKQIAAQIWEQMEPQQKVQFQGFEQFYESGIWKKILQQMQMDQQQEGPQGIASQMPRGMMEEQVSMSERMPARFGGDMDPRPTPTGNFLNFPGEIMNTGGDQMFDEKSTLKETIDTPKGIETLTEEINAINEGTRKVSPNQRRLAGGGARGFKAQMVAEDIAQERYGREFYDLSQALQMEIYSEALEFIDSGGE